MQLYSCLGLFLLALAACSDSTSSGSSSGTVLDAGSSSSSSSSSSSGSSGNATGPLSGTINGTAFTPLSAVSFANTDGTIDLVFSDKADLCSRLVSKELAAGETIVQLLGLMGSGGTYVPSGDPGDLKIAVFDSSCGVSYKTSGSSQYSITVSKNDATGVDGTASILFDGASGTATSTISGTFTATACAATVDENDTCH